MPWGSEWSRVPLSLALTHACEEPSSTGVKPMRKTLWRYRTKGCTDILLPFVMLAGDVLASIPVELTYAANYTWGPQYEVCGDAWRSKTAEEGDSHSSAAVTAAAQQRWWRHCSSCASSTALLRGTRHQHMSAAASVVANFSHVTV
jgi:hypothetical protein